MSEVSDDVLESLRYIEDLKFFLATAPANWQENQVIRRYYLNNEEGFVSCVFWNNFYFITGTDIVRCILYKFQHFGRTIIDRKKFEEGIFSDLRNLKAGSDSVLESPKLEFLEFLYKNACLRTQKKQKVFFWFNVPHDKLMADALERDIKKELAGQPASSKATREPALLFKYHENKNCSLYEQLCEHLGQPKYEPKTHSDDDSDLEPDAPLSAIKQEKHYRDPYRSDFRDPSRPSGPDDPTEKGQPLAYPGTAQSNPQDSAAISNGNGAGPSHKNHVLPAAEEDEDDDFPLDYLDRELASREYIPLEGGNYHTAAYINSHDNDFDNLDTSMFQQTINVVSNDDYLIEQTLPSRGALSSTSLNFPYLAKYMEEQAFFQPYYPHMQHPPSAVMAPMGFDPYHEHQPYHYDPEYMPQFTSLMPAHAMIHYDQPVISPGYGYFEDAEAQFRHSSPSQRQQEISSSMMRKRQQLHYNRSRVLKPPRQRRVDHDSRKTFVKEEPHDPSLVHAPAPSPPEPDLDSA